MEVRQVKINTPQGERLFIITQLEKMEGGTTEEMSVNPLPVFKVHVVGLSFGEFYNNPVVIDCNSMKECENAIEAITYAININH